MAEVDQEIERRTVQNVWPFWIVTANPEILLYARSHEEYASVLRQADVRTVDGFGLQMMLRLVGEKTERVTGVELAEHLLQVADTKKWRVALIGGRKESAHLAQVHIQKRFPEVITMAEMGGKVSKEGEDDVAGEEARHRLTFFSPDMLFVCFGHPKQERWIARYLADFPSVKIVVGVGGTVDFWAHTIKRAPQWMRRLGIEWMWRLLQQPSRFIRILRAVILFPMVFLVDWIVRRKP